MSAFNMDDIRKCSNDAKRGTLQFTGVPAIQTPHYIAISSKGVVPHLTHDSMRKETEIVGIYSALEDYAEEVVHSVTRMSCGSSQSTLKKFIALQSKDLLVLGPRRIPPLSPLPEPNTYTSLTVLTANGWRQLEIQDYVSLTLQLKPDIVIGPADLVIGEKDERPGLKRKNKMDERTAAWMRAMLEAVAKERECGGTLQLWAPILPIEGELQRSYRDLLEDYGPEAIGGVVIYDGASTQLIPPSLETLPRLSLSNVLNPHAVLRMIELGVDMVTVPFVNTATEAGIALNFAFPDSSLASSSSSSSSAHGRSGSIPSLANLAAKLPFGYSLWQPSLASDLLPLVDGCACFTCKNHHRAYIHHLLDAKEMLAWVLLQIHNHFQLDNFFSGIRSSLKSGTFAEDVVRFNRSYAEQLPSGGGEGPRVRGYQTSSSVVAPGKVNQPARRRLERAEFEKIETRRLEGADTKLDDQAQQLAEGLLDQYDGIGSLL